MELKVAICPSEREISQLIGKENWSSLINNSTKNQPVKCFFCGYPQKEQNFNQINLTPKLRHHILPFDTNLDVKKDFNEIKIVITCDACHAIQHFDFGVKQKWFKLVNSNFDQTDLVKMCRWGNKIVNAYVIGNQEIEKSIFLLKKTPEIYLNEIIESNLNYNDKIKVVFTKFFNWDNCR